MLREWRRRGIARGFTIVELLIVVVVIAILAAITVVSYNGITNQATDTTVKNDMRQFAQKIELFKVSDSTELYPKGSQLTGLGISFTKSAYDTSINNLLYCNRFTELGTGGGG